MLVSITNYVYGQFKKSSKFQQNDKKNISPGSALRKPWTF